MKDAIRENYQPSPASSLGDFFVAIPLRNEWLVKSSDIKLPRTFREFWDFISEWTWVELHWWCDDHKIPKEPTIERDEIISAIKPSLFHINMHSGVLTLIENDAVYQEFRKQASRLERRFAFFDTATPSQLILPLLHRRITEIHPAENVPPLII